MIDALSATAALLAAAWPATLAVRAREPRRGMLAVLVWLPLIERAVTAGLASAADLVYLQDRVSMHHDRPQSHGTQRLGYSEGHARLWPVTDPGTLNTRRAALDLPPLADAAIADAWTPAELAEHGRHLTDPTS